jgi:hypothetical protein
MERCAHDDARPRTFASRAAASRLDRRHCGDDQPCRDTRGLRATGTAVSASACERSDHAPCGRRFVTRDSHNPHCNARRDPHALTLSWRVSVFPNIAERRLHLVCAGGDLCPDESDAYTGRRVLPAGAGALAATAGSARADAGGNPTGVDRLSRGAAHWHGCTHRLEPMHHGSGPRRSGQPRAGRTTAVPALHYGLQRQAAPCTPRDVRGTAKRSRWARRRISAPVFWCVESAISAGTRSASGAIPAI